MYFQWYKDNSPLQGANSPYLQLYGLQDSDSGMYNCVMANDCGTLISDTLEFKVKDCTGLDEFGLQSEIKIYPNPSKGVLSVVIPKRQYGQSARIKIIDIRGRVFLENNLSERNTELSLDAEVPSGIYIVEITLDGITHRSKIILERD